MGCYGIIIGKPYENKISLKQLKILFLNKVMRISFVNSKKRSISGRRSKNGSFSI